jgi:uncharacterized membrane protein
MFLLLNGVNICVNIRTALDKCRLRKLFHYSYFYLSSYFTFCIMLFILRFNINYTQEFHTHNYVLVVTLLFRFWNNIITIRITVKIDISPFILLYMYQTSTL